MKKLSLLILILLLRTLAFPQDDVNRLFSQSPEVIIKFHIQDRSQLETLTRLVSIDNVIDNEVIAYTNKEEFEQFLTLNIPYEIVEKPILTPEELNMKDFAAIQKSRADWDSYPSYDAYVSMMQQFATDYPDICRLEEFGTTVQNRKLLACVLSNNVNVREAEPQVLWSSTMHGDECTGYVLMLRYIDYLLSNYGTNARVTYLLDNMEIWICPLANPDGTYHTGNGDVNGAIRNNANNVDLNRNYKDWKYGDHPDNKTWQVETLAFMDLQDAETFVLGVNLHGGNAVCNYPWDNTYTYHADDDWWFFVCREYADTVHVYNPNYLTDFQNGVVRGCNWYVISGGRQDYCNYYRYHREFTLEISVTKIPPASQLPNYWNWNYRSFLNYTQQALYGIHGTVTDACTKEPLYAKIFIAGHDVNESYVMTDPRVGYYVRPIKAGTYSVTYSADGYTSQTKSITISDRQQVVQNIELASVTSPTLPPVADFTADQTIFIAGETAKVQFSDLSTNCTDQWQWYFEGGTPETSTEQNPVVTYNAKKSLRAEYFDVKLIATNAYGEDSMLKEGYIKIGLPPVSDFTADPTTITANHSVSFSDMTENEPAAWSWDFEGGTPESSTEQNPVIVYKHPGTYSVTLTTDNIFGEHSTTKENYITVTETIFPIADFIADTTHITPGATVQFTDVSENATSWEWFFEGGTPETSEAQNPTVVYENEGVFDVKLTVTNDDGSDTMLKEDYIVVENVAIGELEGLKVKIFPNPVSQGATITVEADAPLRKIVWINMSGMVVKTDESADYKSAQATGNKSAQAMTISVSGVGQGIYLLKIETAKGVSVTKIEVQ